MRILDRIFGVGAGRLVSFQKEASAAVSGNVAFYQPPLGESSVSVRACESRLELSVAGLTYERLIDNVWTGTENQAIDTAIGSSFTRLIRDAVRSFAAFGFAVVYRDNNRYYVLDPTECELKIDKWGEVVGVDFDNQSLDNFSVAYRREFGNEKIYCPRLKLKHHISTENNMVRGADGLSENRGIMAVVIGAPRTSETDKAGIREAIRKALSGKEKTAVVVVEDVSAGGVSMVGGDVQDVLSPPSVSAIQMLVASEYSIPKDLINPEDSNRSSSEVAQSVYIRDTVLPIAWDICECLNKAENWQSIVGQIRPAKLIDKSQETQTTPKE